MNRNSTTADRLNPEVTPTLPLWPDTGELLGLGRASTYAAAKRGEIPTLKLGARVVVPTAALRRMLQLDEPHVAAHVLVGAAR